MATHPPKVETFDIDNRTNLDPKGHLRPVDTYHVAPHGLYLSRAVVDHPTLVHLRSWLLPDLGLRVTDFTWRPGHERPQDYYLDVVDVHRDGARWHTEDHYLDLVVRTGAWTELIDLDEFVEAVAAGLLAPQAAERALRTSTAAVAGLHAHGHDLDRWLATREIALRWW